MASLGRPGALWISLCVLHGVLPVFATRTRTVTVPAALACRSDGTAYIADIGPVTLTRMAESKSCVAASRAIPARSWIVVTSRYSPGLAGIVIGIVNPERVRTDGTTATTAPSASGLIRPIRGGSTGTGDWTGFVTTDTPAGSVVVAGEAVGVGDGAGPAGARPGCVGATGSSGSQRVPSETPGGRSPTVVASTATDRAAAVPAIVRPWNSGAPNVAPCAASESGPGTTTRSGGVVGLSEVPANDVATRVPGMTTSDRKYPRAR